MEDKNEQKDPDQLQRLEHYLRGTKSKRQKKKRKKQDKDGKGGYVGSILIVDADPEAAEKARVILRSQLYDVEVRDDGHSALELIEKKAFFAEKFDAMLIAKNLPTLDGIETTRLLRDREKRAQVTKRMPIIVYTSRARNADLHDYMEAGMDGCVSKPVDRAALLNTIKQAVPQHNPQAPLSPRSRMNQAVDVASGGKPKKPDLSGIPSSRRAKPRPTITQSNAFHKLSDQRVKDQMDSVGGRRKKRQGTENDIVGVFQLDADHQLPFAVVQVSAEIELLMRSFVHK